MTTPRPAAFFTPDGDGFIPSSMARGPWGSTIGGNFVGGILGHVLENAVAEPGWQPTRLTVDLLRPAALARVLGRASIIRQGRRLTLVEAELLQADTVVARASGLFLRTGEQPPGEIWTTPLAMPPLPPPSAVLAGVPLLIWTYGKNPDVAGPSFDLTQWQHDGPKFVWVRDLVPLVDGVPMTPFTRASMAGDVASSLTHYGTTGLNYINADYTLVLSRLPEGNDIGLAALTYSGHDGIATGTAAIFDHRGQIGTATATTLANRGFNPPSLG
jgi:acyl-CoA thioesterase superfamily protein/acyl-Coa thioesterase superfamily protein